MTHSSGRVFILILWARAVCFLASQLTTVSLDYLFLLYMYIDNIYIRVCTNTYVALGHIRIA